MSQVLTDKQILTELSWENLRFLRGKTGLPEETIQDMYLFVRRDLQFFKGVVFGHTELLHWDKENLRRNFDFLHNELGVKVSGMVDNLQLLYIPSKELQSNAKSTCPKPRTDPFQTSSSQKSGQRCSYDC